MAVIDAVAPTVVLMDGWDAPPQRTRVLQTYILMTVAEAVVV